jgi:DNA-binding helix-hairpin-helix protein with protein kinase domain
MSPEERRAFMQGAIMTERAAQGERMLRWVPPAEREATLRMFEAMSPEERQALRRRIQATPAAERNDLRRRIVAMDADERRRFLLESP